MESCLRIVKGLKAATSAGAPAEPTPSASPAPPPPPPPRVLFVVDDYNALYGPTGYGAASSGHAGASASASGVKRKPLQVQNLALVSERAPQGCAAVGDAVKLRLCLRRWLLPTGRTIQPSRGHAAAAG